MLDFWFGEVIMIPSLFDHLRFYLFPSLCAYCKKFLLHSTIFCNECSLKIFPIVSKKIDITPTISVTVFALSDYKDPLKKLIIAKSWSDSIASYQLGNLLNTMLLPEALNGDILIPIPLHWTRYAWRGFNQAHEIAKVISKKRNIPVHHLLKRIKKTPFQSVLPSTMRADNVKDAFVLNANIPDAYRDKHLVLIDDLMTTGATLRTAAKLLLPLKPKKITAIVVCRIL